MSTNYKQHIIFIIIATFWLLPLRLDAQVMDFIEDQVTGYIKEKAEDYIDEQSGGMYYKAKTFLNNPIGTLWGAYVEESARSSVCEKARGLASFNLNDDQLNELRKKYDIDPLMPTNQKTLLLPIQYGISESMKLVVAPKGNQRLDLLGNGLVERHTQKYVDSLRSRIDAKRIEDVLCRQTQDSIRAIADERTCWVLLDDLNTTPQLITTMNRHPETVRVYVNSRSTDLRNQPAHLIYWAKMADAHRSRLSKKTKMPNPRMLLFEQDRNVVKIKYEDKLFGTYDPTTRTMTCISAELLNFMPMPNCTYKYENTTFFTDKLGRLICLDTPVNTKENSVTKTSVKMKDLQESINVDSKTSLYYKMLKKMKIQPAMAFLATPATNLDNTLVKEKQKMIKSVAKENPRAFADFKFSYDKGSLTPKRIEIGTVTYVNNPNAPQINTEAGGQNRFMSYLAAVKSEHYVMDGTINGKYPVVMNIICQNGIVTGNYFYSKFGDEKRMTLRGSIDNDHHVKMKEYDENGTFQGEFQGFINDGKFSGKFLKGDKEMPFVVSEKLPTKHNKM